MDFVKILLDNFFEILAITITFIAFYLPWRTAYRKYISVEWADKIEKVNVSQLSLGKAQYLHKAQNKFAYICTVKVTNPSNMDIGFFELNAIDCKKQYKHMIMFKSTVLPEYQHNPLLLDSLNSAQIVLEMPPSDKGVFKANSFTKFDLVITAAPGYDIGDSIQVNFRVTYNSIKSRWFSLLATIRNRKNITFYHTFSNIYKLDK